MGAPTTAAGLDMGLESKPSIIHFKRVIKINKRCTDVMKYTAIGLSLTGATQINGVM